jgi:NADPH:quinone reductase-like Zn-dependent oxidoreductase
LKAVVFEKFGDPAEVLQVREVPEPVPGPGQVRVCMLASPIGPADVLTVRGEYGYQPKLPATPGTEGVGIVEAGRGLLGRMRVGRRVAVLNETGGNWQEKVVVSALRVVPISNHVPDDQAATFFVNPATAFIMTRLVLKVPPRAWLLQTAAGSALGKMVIRLGRHFGFRTINVVRRREQAEEILRAGGDEAIASESESIEDRVRAITNGEGISFALDAVGGKTGSAVVRSLARGGRLLVYGTLAEEPLSLPSRMLFLGVKRIDGFWLSDWARRQNVWTMLRLFRRIHQLMAKRVLSTDVGPAFTLDDIKAAIRQASTPGRNGKVLLKMSSAWRGGQ